MPNKKASHADNLKKVCLLCFNKGKVMRNVSQHVKELIEEHLISGLNPEQDNRLPVVICNTCYTILLEAKKGVFMRSISLVDFSVIQESVKPITDPTETCKCIVCEVARCVLNQKIKHSSYKIFPHQKVGRPVKKDTASPSAIKVCSICLSQIHKGFQHTCTKTSKLNNIKRMVSDSTSLCDEQLASHILKEKAASLKKDTVYLSQNRGLPLRVDLFAHKQYQSVQSHEITHDNIDFIKNDLGLSQNKTKRLARNLRACTKNRRIIQCGLKSHLTESLHALDEYFETRCIVIGDESHTVTFCNDIAMLVEYVKKARQLSVDADLLFKIGTDFGGHFLKICMNIIVLNHQSPPVKKRMKHSDNLSDTYKDTSVNKLIILAAAHESKESYETVKCLFDLLSIHTLEQYGNISIAADLKMANIMFGLMSHASSHPCTWCICER